jgi:hypothetical protein
MTTNDNSTFQIDRSSLTKRMAVGAGIGLVLITLFLFTAGTPDPSWPRFWRIQPLIIVPLAGAMGGLCNYFLVHHYNLIRLNKTFAIILSVLIFVIGLWMGIVLGLDGTYWD